MKKFTLRQNRPELEKIAMDAALCSVSQAASGLAQMLSKLDKDNAGQVAYEHYFSNFTGFKQAKTNTEEQRTVKRCTSTQ